MAIVYTECSPAPGTAIMTSEIRLMIWADQAAEFRFIVPGLTGLRMPVGIERGTDEILQAGTIAFDAPTQPKRTSVGFKLDFYPTDVAQYELYKRAECQNDDNNDVWFFQVLEASDRTKDQIWIPNHILYPNSGVSVQNFNIPETDLKTHQKVDGVFNIGSTGYILATEHLFDDGTPQFSFTANTIVNANNDFDVEKIFPKDKVFIDDLAATPLNANFRQIVTILTVDPGLITTVESTLAVGPGLATNVLRIGRQW